LLYVLPGEVFLLCKGAESAMLDRVVAGDKATTLAHVNEYAMVRLYNLLTFSRFTV